MKKSKKYEILPSEKKKQLTFSKKTKKKKKIRNFKEKLWIFWKTRWVQLEFLRILEVQNGGVPPWGDPPKGAHRAPFEGIYIKYRAPLEKGPSKSTDLKAISYTFLFGGYFEDFWRFLAKNLQKSSK